MRRRVLIPNNINYNNINSGPACRCLKEDPATMSLLQRSLDPEKTLGLVDVLYTAVFDINRWKERK